MLPRSLDLGLSSVSSTISSCLRCFQRTVHVSPAVFTAAAVPPDVAALNRKLEAAASGTPLVSSTTPQAARVKRAAQFKHEPRRIDESIPGLSEGAPPVGISIFKPRAGAVRASYLHFHGGGFILGSAYGQSDTRLQRMADELQLAVVSVEYRLAPEAQWPLPVDDCVAAALWLAEHGRERLGTPVHTIGGESAGAHLALCTLLRLRDEHRSTVPPPDEIFRCANLVYGWYDLGGTPSMRAFDRRLVFCSEELAWMASQLVPDAARRDARAGPEAGGASPLYSPLHRLPPALFTVGTDDALRDDTLFMASRWAAHGIPCELEVYPGAAHGVGHFGPHEHSSQGAQINARVDAYLSAALANS